MNRRVLIWSYEHNAWWAPNAMGYTLTAEEAGRFTPFMAGLIVADSFPDEIIVSEGYARKHGAPDRHPYSCYEENRR